MTKLFFCLLAILGVAAAFLTKAGTNQTQTHMTDPRQRLEEAAIAARDGGSDEIDALSDAVIQSPHSFSLPDPVRSMLSHELASAEKRYRLRTGPGITESQLVDSLNFIGEKLNAPRYAKVTALQVRVLGMRMAITHPAFMGIGLSQKPMKVDESVDTTLSPLQAAHLFAAMIDQKWSNPDFADTAVDPIESRKAIQEKDEQARKAKGLDGKANTLVSHETDPKNAEIRRAAKASIDGMSLEDGLALADGLLKRTGLM
jgi:hypothetical protein